MSCSQVLGYAFTIISCTMQVAALGLKVADVADSAMIIHSLRKKETLDKEEEELLVAEIATATFKSLDIVATGASAIGGYTSSSYAPLFKQIRIATSCFAGVARIYKESVPFMQRKEINVEDKKNLLGVALVQIIDFTGAVAEIKRFDAIVQGAITSAHQTAIFGSLYLWKTSLKTSSSPSIQWATRKVLMWAIRFFKQKEAPTACKTSASNIMENDLLALIAPSHINTPTESESHHQRIYNRVKSACKELEEIPGEWAHFEAFKQFKCCITRKAIRFPVCPIGDDHTTILYEKKNILQWLNSNQSLPLPPQWPEKIEFLSKNIVENHFCQKLIDKEIKTQMWAKQTDEEGNTMEKVASEKKRQ